MSHKNSDYIDISQIFRILFNEKKIILSTVFLTTLFLYIFFSYRPTVHDSKVFLDIGSYMKWDYDSFKEKKIEEKDSLIRSLERVYIYNKNSIISRGESVEFAQLGKEDLLEIIVTSDSLERNHELIDHIFSYILLRHQEIRENSIDGYNHSIDFLDNRINFYLEERSKSKDIEFALLYENIVVEMTETRENLLLALENYQSNHTISRIVFSSDSNSSVNNLFILMLGVISGLIFSLFLIILIRAINFKQARIFD